MSGCANVVEEIEQEMRRGEAEVAGASEGHNSTGTGERRGESDADRVTGNGIRFAINSHICED